MSSSLYPEFRLKTSKTENWSNRILSVSHRKCNNINCFAIFLFLSVSVSISLSIFYLCCSLSPSLAPGHFFLFFLASCRYRCVYVHVHTKRHTIFMLHQMAGIKQKTNDTNDRRLCWNDANRENGRAWSLIKSLYPVCMSYAYTKENWRESFCFFWINVFIAAVAVSCSAFCPDPIFDDTIFATVFSLSISLYLALFTL